jgi:hypothetical protein
MTAVFDDVALAIDGNGNGGSDDGEVHLASMGVTREGQADAFGDSGEEVGVVSNEDDGLGWVGLGEDSGDIGLLGPEVVEATDPKGSAVVVDSDGAVAEYRDAVGLQGVADLGSVVPPIVIPEYGIDAQGRFQAGEDRGVVGGFGARTVGYCSTVVVGEVAEEDDDIGVLGVGLVDDFAEVIEVVECRADVEVGECGDGQGLGPAG